MVPVFNEAGNIDAVCALLHDLARSRAEFDWEFLFVDDGSTDATLAMLQESVR